jgi:hypothetical protein
MTDDEKKAAALTNFQQGAVEMQIKMQTLADLRQRCIEVGISEEMLSRMMAVGDDPEVAAIFDDPEFAASIDRAVESIPDTTLEDFLKKR